MATINKSDMSSDRRGAQGKGDLARPGTVKGVRNNNSLWGTSSCCSAPTMRLQGLKTHLVCESCGKFCGHQK